MHRQLFAGLSDPHFIEKIVTNVAGRMHKAGECSLTDSLGSVAVGREETDTIPFEEFLDILLGASQGIVTPEIRLALQKIVDAQKKTLVERVSSKKLCLSKS